MMSRLFVVALLLSAAFASAQGVDPDQLMREAVAAQRRGDFQTAIHDYRSVLQARPNAVEAKVNLGAALAQVGQFDEAIALYKSALPHLKEKREVLMNLALAYYKKGDFQHANERLSDLYRGKPGDIRIAILLGDTDVKLSRFDDAVRLLTPLESADSANLDLEYILGSALIGAVRPREGVSRVQKFADATHNPEAHLLAGVTLLQLNDYAPARTALEAAAQEDPQLPGVYTVLGTTRDKMNDTAGAEAAFREALKMNPNDVDANVYLGGLLVKRRALAEAKPYLDRGLQLDPSSLLGRYEMALWESTSGQYEAAAEQLEKLVKEKPEWLDPHVELASLYYRLHRPEDGLRERKTVEQLTAQQQQAGQKQ